MVISATDEWRLEYSREGGNSLAEESKYGLGHYH